jgi:FkbM family methyltransferase
MIKKIKAVVKKIVFQIVPSLHSTYTPASYSQAGEDAVIRFLFADFGKSNISYLDLGTNCPDVENNTFLFYTRGCRGVCVEADSTLISKIKKVRPEDKVINAGVSVSTQHEADFYVFDAPTLNTFDKSEADFRTSLGIHKVINVVKVPLININDLIKNNFINYPDLLSIDIEGLDLVPLPVICIETCKFSETHIRPKDKEIIEFMLAKGYEIYADTYINTIFVNQKWFNKQ